MADTHHDAGHGHGDQGHGNLFNLYMAIALALAVATASSFLFNWLGRPVAEGGAEAISRFAAFILILAVAILKASLVGWIFMHLKWDWKLLYFIIGPVFVMAAMMAVVFLPDILLGPNKDMADGYKIAAQEQPHP